MNYDSVSKLFDSWFNTDNEIAQYGFSLLIGVIFAPLGSGIFLLVIWIIIYEILYYMVIRSLGKSSQWDSQLRIGIIFSSLLGWIIGRQIFNKDILQVGRCPLVLNRYIGAISIHHDCFIDHEGKIRPRYKPIS